MCALAAPPDHEGRAGRHKAPLQRPGKPLPGIGGFFFRAKDPAGLAKWYEEAPSALSQVPRTYDVSPWTQEELARPCFSPFPEASDYFGTRSQRFMINFRVNNLERLVSQLTEAGIEVKVDPEEYPNEVVCAAVRPGGQPHSTLANPSSLQRTLSSQAGGHHMLIWARCTGIWRGAVFRHQE